MCGICGFNWKDPDLIKKMTKKINHRGPDAQGSVSYDLMSLGNARLSILDLSDNGNQPMMSENSRYTIVYNGEIYNHLDIRESLIKKGYQFKSTTDTETVLNAYLEYGTQCLNLFNGMFAIAIYDQLNKELFIARDRIGIKPLYYYKSGQDFIFASEIKCILESDKVKKEVNIQSLYHYCGYEFTPAPYTMFSNIYKLKQGHYAVFKNGELKMSQYWDFKFSETDMNEDELCEELYKRLNQSVERRLLSDVPLGVFLSGGLDSSTLTALVKKLYPNQLKSFSIGYKDKTFSELPFAEEVSTFCQTEHNVLMIDPVQPEDIEESLYHLDEPMTDLSTIPFHLISKKAREQVKVCLSGEGGDEVFLGYDRFKAARLNSYYSRIPSLFRNHLINPLIMMFPDQPQKKGMINMLKRFIEGSMYPDPIGAMRWQFFLNEYKEKRLFSEKAKNMINFGAFDPIEQILKGVSIEDSVNRDIYVDIKLTMADSVLMKVDKMSMATSLEVRVPFLDHELIEFAAMIPHQLKLKGMTTKYILRKTLSKYKLLPPKIIDRGKQGYSLPVKNWLRLELKDYMIDLLKNSEVIKETINQEYLDSLIKEHISMKHNHNHILWALMNVALWYKRFF